MERSLVSDHLRLSQRLLILLPLPPLVTDTTFALEAFKGQLQARLEETRSHPEVMRHKREKLEAEMATWREPLPKGIDRPRCSMNSGSARGNSTISAKNSSRLMAGG